MRVMLVVFAVCAMRWVGRACDRRIAGASPVGTTRYQPRGELRVGTSGECPGGQEFTVAPRGHGLGSSLGVDVVTEADSRVEIRCADLGYVEG